MQAAKFWVDGWWSGSLDESIATAKRVGATKVFVAGELAPSTLVAWAAEWETGA